MLGLFMRWGGWAAAIPLVVGLLAGYAYFAISADAGRLDAEGVTATATVTGKRTERRRGGSGTYTTDNYVRVSYSSGSALGGSLEIHFAEKTVSSDFYESVARGDDIEIRYLPDDPETVEIEPGAVAGNAVWAGIAGAAMLVLGIALAAYILRSAARAARIRDSGAETEATVDKLIQQGQFTILEFSFADRSGARHTAKARPRRRSKLEGIEQGTAIRVHYDPDNPARAYWQRDVAPRGA